jgi:multisubunit Na+/H+ antiporter MnhE subunit
MKKIKLPVKRFIKMFVFAFAIWLILNPSLEKHNLYFAAIVSFLSSLFFVTIAGNFISPNVFDFFFKKDFYKYSIFMAKEVILSSYSILKSALTTQKYKSKIVAIPIPQKIPTGKLLLLSSSITLTPGTSVVLIEDGKIYIHCLIEENESIQNGEFVNKILSFKF